MSKKEERKSLRGIIGMSISSIVVLFAMGILAIDNSIKVTFWQCVLILVVIVLVNCIYYYKRQKVREICISICKSLVSLFRKSINITVGVWRWISFHVVRLLYINTRFDERFNKLCKKNDKYTLERLKKQKLLDEKKREIARCILIKKETIKYKEQLTHDLNVHYPDLSSLLQDCKSKSRKVDVEIEELTRLKKNSIKHRSGKYCPMCGEDRRRHLHLKDCIKCGLDFQESDEKDCEQLILQKESELVEIAKENIQISDLWDRRRGEDCREIELVEKLISEQEANMTKLSVEQKEIESELRKKDVKIGKCQEQLEKNMERRKNLSSLFKFRAKIRKKSPEELRNVVSLQDAKQFFSYDNVAELASGGKKFLVLIRKNEKEEVSEHLKGQIGRLKEQFNQMYILIVNGDWEGEWLIADNMVYTVDVCDGEIKKRIFRDIGGKYKEAFNSMWEQAESQVA
jgi:uncharacterized protein (DUF983 family)